MSKLEALQPYSTVRGVLPDCLVTVVNVQWFGSAALELTYKTPAGKVANELLYRHDEPRIEVVNIPHEVRKIFMCFFITNLFRVVDAAVQSGVDRED